MMVEKQRQAHHDTSGTGYSVKRVIQGRNRMNDIGNIQGTKEDGSLKWEAMENGDHNARRHIFKFRNGMEIMVSV